MQTIRLAEHYTNGHPNQFVVMSFRVESSNIWVFHDNSIFKSMDCEAAGVQNPFLMIPNIRKPSLMRCPFANISRQTIFENNLSIIFQTVVIQQTLRSMICSKTMENPPNQRVSNPESESLSLRFFQSLNLSMSLGRLSLNLSLTVLRV